MDEAFSSRKDRISLVNSLRASLASLVSADENDNVNRELGRVFLNLSSRNDLLERQQERHRLERVTKARSNPHKEVKLTNRELGLLSEIVESEPQLSSEQVRFDLVSLFLCSVSGGSLLHF